MWASMKQLKAHTVRKKSKKDLMELEMEDSSNRNLVNWLDTELHRSRKCNALTYSDNHIDFIRI